MENDDRSETIRTGQARARAAGKSIDKPPAVFHRGVFVGLPLQGQGWRRISHRTGLGVGTVGARYADRL